MTYEIKWDKKVKEFLENINKIDSQIIIKKVNSIVDYPKHYLGFLVNIKGYKLRIGDYRVIIDLDESNKLIDVLLVEHRKNIYKYLKRTGFMSKN